MSIFESGSNKPREKEESSVEKQIEEIKASIEGDEDRGNEMSQELRPEQFPWEPTGEEHAGKSTLLAAQKFENPAAPLFVKLDKYKNILEEVSQMKANVEALRRSFEMLQKLEATRDHAMKLMHNAIRHTQTKLDSLNEGLIRPKGFREANLSNDNEIKAVDTTISDLKSQLEQLRSELSSVE
jgi:hypothetical protein